MKALELPCDTNPRDRLTLARVGGCAAFTVRAKQHQVNLTPARAREAAAWLLAFADDMDGSLADLRERRAALDELVEIAQDAGLGYLSIAAANSGGGARCSYCDRLACDCCAGDYRCCDPADRCRRHQ